MRYRRSVKKAALIIPPLRRLILEKDKLLVQTRSQAAQIDSLLKQNKELQHNIYELRQKQSELEKKLFKEAHKEAHNEITWPLLKQHILSQGANKKLASKTLFAKHGPPHTLNWVVPAVKQYSGGQHIILRVVSYLVNKGHHCRVYIFDPREKSSLSDQKNDIKEMYPDLNVEVFYNSKKFAEADAIFATHWTTAYPVYNFEGSARKFYFIQDFEPYFYPLGTEYVLAENTYKMNFHGITAGRWLAEKLSKEYGMTCDSYDFGVEKKLYRYANKSKRKEIFFYARPTTPRRGFELGILALEEFHKRMPGYTINLAGFDVANYNISFPHKNFKVLRLNQLTDLYNKCATALVISLTNMSLLPLELLACGVIPVVNDGPNNRKVSNNPHIHYARPHPISLANALVDVVSKKDLVHYADEAAKSVNNRDWELSNQKIEELLVRELSA